MSTDARPPQPTSVDDLKGVYGADLLDHPPLISQARFAEKLGLRHQLDPHYARMSMEFASGVQRRSGLDRRLRYLIEIGMLTVGRSPGHLADSLDGAFSAGVPARDLLETIFLAHIYAGDLVVDLALPVFAEVAARHGVLDDLRADRLPIDRGDRDLAAERATWSEEFANDPRLSRLIDEYGWQGVATGYRYRGVYHLDALEYLEKLDLSWGKLWESMAYEGMYSRGVLDDKTRLLCTVGDCVALGASGMVPAKEHIREALHFGNSPQEVLEVLYLAGLHFGFPIYITVRGIFVQIMADLGRLDEIGNVVPPKAIDARR
ncbi:MAG TPA: carboxymuconolactone decarboxylase family protein [Candidatus Limnocylindrales bacterium]|nr:carboxymuconolactone decarboxylase family protein [Candidatus Limnocylindrales bacterium]